MGVVLDYLEVVFGVQFSQDFKDSHVDFLERSLAQILKPWQVHFCFFVVMIGLEKIDALLDLSQDFSKLLWVLDCFVVIEDVGALFLVLVMQLVFLDFAHDAGQDVFSI